MTEFLQIFGAISLGILCLAGLCAIIGFIVEALSPGGNSADEWEESENSELERSVTIEEFCLAQPLAQTSPPDGDGIFLLEPTPPASHLTRRTTKKTTLKTSSLSRPQGET